MNIRQLLAIATSLIFIFLAIESDAQHRYRGSTKYGKKRRHKSKTISHYRGGAVGGKFRPYSFLTGNVNALNYYGDLAPVHRMASTDIDWTRPGMGVNVGHKFNPHMSVRAGFNYGRIKGDDQSSDPGSTPDLPRYYRNASFRNDIKEFHVGFEYYLNPNYGGPNVRHPFNVYLFLGGAVYHHEPKGKVPDLDYTTGGVNPAPQAGEWVRLRPLGTEGQFIDGVGVDKSYSPIQFSIPMGLGVKMRLPGGFDLGAEFGYRYMFTDYLDDVSSRYVGFDKFDDPLARIMSDRSAEPYGVLSGNKRDLPIASQSLNGTIYYSSGGANSIGGGIDEGAIRGQSSNADMVFMSTISLTYIIGSRVRRVAKFR